MIFIYHIAKTGGTTLLKHSREELGKDKIASYGFHTNITKFFKGEPLFEELGADAYKRIKVVIGHQVSARATYSVLPYLIPDFLACFRDPYDHFISQYRHSLLVKGREGAHFSAKKYLKQQRVNRVSEKLFNFFSPLASGEEFNEENLKHVLRCFRFLPTTDDLSASAKGFTDALGISPIAGKARVSQNEYSLDGLTRDDILEKCEIDHRIYQAVKEGRSAKSGLQYDENLKTDCLKKLSMRDNNELVADAYERLAVYMENHGFGDAAHLYLQLTNQMQNPKFAPILNKKPVYKSDETRRQARAKKEVATVYYRFQDYAQAHASICEALDLNPDFLDAFHLKAKICVASDDKEGALTALQGLLERAPNHKQGLALQQRIGA